MYIKSELINEVQKLVDLLEITYIKIRVFLKNNNGYPDSSFSIDYENKHKKNHEIIVNQPRAFIKRDAYSITHSKNFFSGDHISLGEDQKRFEENVTNIANILQKVIKNNEIENYIKLAFNTYQTTGWDSGAKEVSFTIDKSIELDYSRFYFNFRLITFSSYKERSAVYKNSFIEYSQNDDDGERYYTLDKAPSLFDVNSYDLRKIVDSAERIRDSLFILDDINYYNVL